MTSESSGNATGSTGSQPSQPLARYRAWGYAAGAVLSLAAGEAVYQAFAPKVDIVPVELGGAGQQWPLPSGAAGALRWDFALIAGYGLALAFGLLIAQAVFRRRVMTIWPVADYGPSERHPGQKISLLGLAWVLAVLAVLADVAENALLLWATSQSSEPRLLLNMATAAAVAKFCALVPAALVALSGLIVGVIRLVRNKGKRLEGLDIGDDAFHPREQGRKDGSAADTQPPQHGRWIRGYTVPGLDHAALHDPPGGWPVVGFCLSGGGVRSASVVLGALQSLREELLAARYLVSVSGGGYTAGALQLALTSATSKEHPPAGAVLHDPQTVLMPGTVEEDRIRRHARYIADTPAQLVVALGTLAKVFLLSLFAIFGPAIVIGYLAGRAYHVAQLAPWTATSLYPWDKTIAYPGVRTGTLWAEGALAALALIIYALYLWLGPTQPNPARWLRTTATGLTAAALAVAVLAIAIPSVVYASAWLLHHHAAPFSAAGSVCSVVLAYIAMLVSATRRKQKKSTAVTGWLAKARKSAPAALQSALVALTLAVLAAGWLLLFGGVAAVAFKPGAALTALIVFIGLLLVGGAMDATGLSLHPFYRRRLAGAFAARRVEYPGGQVVADGYDFGERTVLSAYGKRSSDPDHTNDFPEIIFAAAANMTGEQCAPLDAVSYTLTGDWTGGPDIGYVRTRDLEEHVSPQLRSDLTVEAAMAVSGAAFASAMGRMGRWYGTLLAVTGARLGSWLPNPVFLHDLSESARARDWTVPRVPAMRRLPYLFREILGIHHYGGSLLQVTDGGHYDNLGLVELLRRRCSLIYCIDASGDAPPVAGTLRQAMDLAQAELGVSFPDQAGTWDLVPGSAKPTDPHTPLPKLNNRLSRAAAIRLPFSYPAESGLPPHRRNGTLIVAKTVLTTEMPYSVLARGASDSLFPHDPTSDQFFDDDKYCSYTELGRELGAAARRQLAREFVPSIVVEEVQFLLKTDD